MSRPLRAEINLSALRHNLQQARQSAPNSKILAVIKANGYGHGMQTVAHALASADAFAVASIDEAITLAESGVPQPIVLLEGVFNDEDLLLLQAYPFQPVVHRISQVEQLEQLEQLEQVKNSQPLTVWLKIDTGMHRLGFAPAEATEVLSRLQSCKCVEKIILMTHFACADDSANVMTAKQIKLFEQVFDEIDLPRSLANSAAILSLADTHEDWIRPGIMLYGASPLLDKSANELALQTVMTLRSEIIAVKTIDKDESVGYGAKWKSEQETRVGVVAVGYGDGYPRHAPSGTPVLVNGLRTQLIGCVSMDMITVDLTDCGGDVGDEVVLWGEGLAADEVASAAGTIAYELFCHITARVPFIDT